MILRRYLCDFTSELCDTTAVMMSYHAPSVWSHGRVAAIAAVGVVGTPPLATNTTQREQTQNPAVKIAVYLRYITAGI